MGKGFEPELGRLTPLGENTIRLLTPERNGVKRCVGYGKQSAPNLTVGLADDVVQLGDSVADDLRSGDELVRWPVIGPGV